MKMTIHFSQNIDGALSNWKPGDYKSALPSFDNWKAAKKWMKLQRFQGKRVLPFGEPCDGFSYETGCPGHEEEEMG